jgi:Secretion system C-terminal sorting domain
MQKNNFLKILSTCFFISLAATRAFAQHIPDANFAAAIRGNCPVCIDVNDNLTASADTLKTLIVQNGNITDLTGIIGFNSLRNLHCDGNQITNFPILPNTLKYIGCQLNALTNLNNLPNGLLFLDCERNSITTISNLPSSLQTFYCNFNLITTINNLPSGLLYFECMINSLTGFPTLPSGLLWLDCDDNQITSLPALPSGLQHLSIGNNPSLYCLPTLPNAISVIYTTGTAIRCLPNVPTSMTNNTIPLCTLPCVAPTSLAWHYTVSNTNVHTFTIDNSQGFPTLSKWVYKNAGITKVRTTTNTIFVLPDYIDEGTVVSLTLYNAVGDSITESQTFTIGNCTTPSYNLNFQSNTIAIAIPSGLRAATTSVYFNGSSTVAATQNLPASTMNTITVADNIIYTDINVVLEYKGLAGNPNNTCTRSFASPLPSCTGMVANIVGSNYFPVNGPQTAQPTLLTASAILPSDSVAVFTYSWNTGATTAGITSTAMGVYTVTATSNRGCTAMQTINLPTTGYGIGSAVGSPITLTCNGNTKRVPIIANKAAICTSLQIKLTTANTLLPLHTSIELSNEFVLQGCDTLVPSINNNIYTAVVFTNSPNDIIINVGDTIGFIRYDIATATLPNTVVVLDYTIKEINIQGNELWFSGTRNINIIGNDSLTYSIYYHGDTNKPILSDSILTSIQLLDAQPNTIIGQNRFTDSNGQGVFSTPSNASYVEISRNAIASAGLAVINSMDAFLINQIIIQSTSSVPLTFAQLAAMDIDRNGVVNGNDITLLQRIRLGFPIPFNWRTWLFIPSSELLKPAYQISSLYPMSDGIGYDSRRVPAIASTYPIPNQVFANCNATIDTMIAVLLGDADASWSASNSGQFRTTTSPELTLDLAAAIHNGSSHFIPIHSNVALKGIDIDFVLPSGIDSVSLESPNAPMQKLDTTINRKYAITSFYNGTNTSAGTCGVADLRIVSNTIPTQAMLQNITAYLNGELATVGFGVCRVTATNNFTNNTQISIFPNPANTAVTIKCSTAIQTITLTDVLGRIVLVENHNGSREATLQTNGLVDGTYFVSVKTENGIKTEKLLLTK